MLLAPAASVFVRNEYILSVDYKWFSVREVVPEDADERT